MSNTEDDEQADAFKETPPMLDEDVVKTLDVPKWLSDERTAGKLVVADLQRKKLLHQRKICTCYNVVLIYYAFYKTTSGRTP